MSDDIEIREYDPAWPDLFQAEAARIEKALGPLAVRIEHFGSTSVVGLAAKPVIDILVGLENLDQAPRVVEALEGLDYAHWHEDPNREERLFFVRWASAAREHRLSHIHATPLDSVFWNEHLAFRDRLRANPQLAKEYAVLKRELALRHRTDRDAYTAGKTAFVRSAS